MNQEQNKPANTSSLQQKIYLTIYKLTKLRVCQSFIQPVNLNFYPDYTTIITKPMSLNTIINKLKQGQYQCMKEIYQDLLLISKNCYLYHRGKSNEEQVKKVIGRYIRSLDVAWQGLRKDIQINNMNQNSKLGNKQQIYKIIQNIDQRINKALLKKVKNIGLVIQQQNQNKIQQPIRNIKDKRDGNQEFQLSKSNKNKEDKNILSKQENIQSTKKSKDNTLNQKSKRSSQRIISKQESRKISQTKLVNLQHIEGNFCQTNIKRRKSYRLMNRNSPNSNVENIEQISQQNQSQQTWSHKISNRLRNEIKQQRQKQKQDIKQSIQEQQIRQNNNQAQKTSNQNEQQQKTQTIVLPLSISRKVLVKTQNKEVINKKKQNNLNQSSFSYNRDNQTNQIYEHFKKQSQVIDSQNINTQSCTQTIASILPKIQTIQQIQKIGKPVIIIKVQQQHSECIRQKLQSNKIIPANSQPEPSFQTFKSDQQTQRIIKNAQNSGKQQESQQKQLQNQEEQIEEQMNKKIKYKLQKYKILLINYVTWIYDKIIKAQPINKCKPIEDKKSQNQQNQNNQKQDSQQQCDINCEDCREYQKQKKMYDQLKLMKSYRYLSEFISTEIENLERGQINLKKILKMLKQFNLWIKLVSGPFLQWRIKQDYVEIQHNIIKCLQKIIEYKKLGPQFTKIVQQTKQQNNQQRNKQNNNQQNYRITRSKVKSSKSHIKYTRIFTQCQINKQKQIKQLNISNRYKINPITNNKNIQTDKNNNNCNNIQDKEYDDNSNSKNNGHQQFMMMLHMDQFYSSFNVVIDNNANKDYQSKKVNKEQLLKGRRIIRKKQLQKIRLQSNQQNVQSFQQLQQQQQFKPSKNMEKQIKPKNPRDKKLNAIQLQQLQKQKIKQVIAQDEKFIEEFYLKSNILIINKFKSKLSMDWNKKLDQVFGAVPSQIKFDGYDHELVSTGLEKKGFFEQHSNFE